MLADLVTNEIHDGRWLTPDKLGGNVMNPQSLNRYAYALNNPATLSDPSGLDPYDNPGDPCSDPTYAESNAQCQGGCGFLNPEECPPACSSLNPESSIYCDCIEYGQCGGYYGWGYGGYGGGGGAIPPPAGQPPLAGGSFVGAASTSAAGQDVIDLTRWGPLWNVLVRACGSCGEVLAQVAGSVGYGLGILGGLIANPVVLNPPAADYHPPKAVPQAPAQASTTGSDFMDALQEYNRALKACAELYPPGPERQECFKRAKAVFDFRTGKTPGPVQ